MQKHINMWREFEDETQDYGQDEVYVTFSRPLKILKPTCPTKIN